MRVTLELLFESEFFHLEQASEAQTLAAETNSRVYTWKTTGKHNWLELGFSNIDSAGLVVLPNTLPNHVTMSDDQIQDD